MGKTILWVLLAWLGLGMVPAWAEPLAEVYHLRDAAGNCLLLQPGARQFCWQVAKGELIKGKLFIVTTLDANDQLTGFRFQEAGRRSRLSGQVDLLGAKAEARLALPPAGELPARVITLPPAPWLKAGCACETPTDAATTPAPTRQAPELPKGQGRTTVLEFLPHTLPPKPVSAIPPDKGPPPPLRHLDALLVLADDETPNCVVLRLPEHGELGAEITAEFCWNRPTGVVRGQVRVGLLPATGAITELTLAPAPKSPYRLQGSISLQRRRAQVRLVDEADKELAKLLNSNIDVAVCDCAVAAPPVTPAVTATPPVTAPATAGTTPTHTTPTYTTPTHSTPTHSTPTHTTPNYTTPPVATATPPASERPAPPFTVERGRIVPSQPYLMELSVLHAGMSYGGAYRMPITLQLWLGREVFNPWGPADQPLAGDLSREPMPRFVTKVAASAGTPLVLGLRLWRRVRPWEAATGPADWEAHQTLEAGDNSRQLLVLRRGDVPPPGLLGTGAGGGPPAWLSPLLHDGKLQIGPGEALLVAELSTNDLTSPLVDYRELALHLKLFAP